jgi:ATP-dependent DNA helicase Q1
VCDRRTDYALLGKLKSHFPTIPVIAVTATASDRVRQDVCDILRLDPSSTRFFRSTADRPNLTYSVRAKPDGAANVIAEMASYIKEHHPHGAGIVYTYSRKDADTVAEALCDCGVIAEVSCYGLKSAIHRPFQPLTLNRDEQAYHSEVSATKKELIHRSWMRNETQVVVATIAFGLGCVFTCSFGSCGVRIHP